MKIVCQDKYCNKSGNAASSNQSQDYKWESNNKNNKKLNVEKEFTNKKPKLILHGVQNYVVILNK